MKEKEKEKGQDMRKIEVNLPESDGANGLTVTIWEGDPEVPLVLAHEDHSEGEAIWNLLREAGVSCTLACIRGIRWEHDLAPWDAPASFKKGNPFTGGAGEHLQVIEKHMLPEIEACVGHTFREKYLAGYSLAGLFAMYSAYLTDSFDGFVSASGSLWFPGFVEFVEAHEISGQVKRAYFSIGDKESKTKNPMMQPVEENTRKIAAFLAEQGIQTTFELNQGGHFVEDDLRLAKGIAWVLRS